MLRLTEKNVKIVLIGPFFCKIDKENERICRRDGLFKGI